MRLINLDSILERIEKEMKYGHDTIGLVALHSWLENRPVFDPASLVTQGRWEPYDHDLFGCRQVDSRCSVCGHIEYTGGHLCTLAQCPNCGVLMEDDSHEKA